MADRFAIDETKEMQNNPASQDPIVGRVDILTAIRYYKSSVIDINY